MLIPKFVISFPIHCRENKALSVLSTIRKLEINLIAALHLKTVSLNIIIWLFVSSKFQIC